MLRRSSPLVVMLVAVACAPAGDDATDPDGGGGGPTGKADASHDRRSLVLAELEEWNANIDDDARAEKFAEMSADVFAFYRGSNHLFWMDHARAESLATFGGPLTWLQGDLHANNYGSFANDDDVVVFDLNDFDEAVLGDYQLDLWRMATSIVLVGRENGLSERAIQAAVDAFTSGYRDALVAFDGNDDETDFAVTGANAFGRLDEFIADVEATKSRRKMLDKWTSIGGDGQTLDVAIDDLDPVDDATAKAIVDAIPAYGDTLSGGLAFDPAYFAVKGVARRLHAGVGSLGTPRYYVLVEGPSDDDDDDVILDIKRQGSPTAFAYLTSGDRARHDAFAHDAERIVVGTKAMGTKVDDHLGWLQLADGVYTVRERSPFKESFPNEELDSETRLTKLAQQWATILAAAHARADDDHRPELVPDAFEAAVVDRTDGRASELVTLVREIAFTYADQVATDFEFFVDAQ